MNSTASHFTEICPNLIRRTGGGWLATSPKAAKFLIGVSAETQEDATEKFRSTFQRWVEILALDTAKES